MVSIRFLLMLSLSAILNLPHSVHAETWTGWRGTSGSAVSQEKNLPTVWSETDNVLWSRSLRGTGNSSPAVTTRHVFLTAHDETDNSLWAICFDRKDGRLLWEKRVGTGALIGYGPPSLFHYRHNPATASPAADEERFYAFFGSGDLVCLDHAGNELWRKNIPDIYGAYDIKFGMASSPRLWGNRLFIACMHKGPSYVLAIDTRTGNEAWLAQRNYPGLGDAPDAYSSPVILSHKDGTAQVIVSGCDHVDAYDTQTGERSWFSAGLNIPDEEYPRIIASPAVGDGVVVASAGRGKQAIAVRGDGAGDVTQSHRLWETPKMTDCPTPTIHKGICYSVRDDGIATAFDLRSGEIVYRKRLGGNRYQASPVVADGKVYFLSLDGKCTVLAEGPDGDVVAQNTLPGDFYATPAISNGVLFLRARTKLYAIGRPMSDADGNTATSN